MNDGFLGLVDGSRHVVDGLPIASPLYLQAPDIAQPDDSLLDAWLASLTPDQFERILDSLARPTLAKVATAG